MTIAALDALRRVRARWTDDIGWPANDDEFDLYEQSEVALADLDALVRAAQACVDECRIRVSPEHHALLNALALVRGDVVSTHRLGEETS